MITRIDRKPTAKLTIEISDLAELIARFEQGTLSAYGFAEDVLGRARVAHPFLYNVDAEIVLRLVPGLPDAVRCVRDADALADRVNIYLDHCDLGPDGPPEIVVATRCVFHSEQFALELFDADEYLILEQHSDPDHPGRLYGSSASPVLTS